MLGMRIKKISKTLYLMKEGNKYDTGADGTGGLEARRVPPGRMMLEEQATVISILENKKLGR